MSMPEIRFNIEPLPSVPGQKMDVYLGSAKPTRRFQFLMTRELLIKISTLTDVKRPSGAIETGPCEDIVTGLI